METRPRDAQATRELLLSAAAEEFAEFGFAGARVDRIAARAGANKRLLYVYFGDKEAVFEAVLARQVDQRANEVPFDAGNLPRSAGVLFDHYLAHPQDLRLVTWRTLEGNEPTGAELAAYRAKLDAVRQAQRAGLVTAAIPAADLLAITVRIIASWLAAPPALVAAAGGDRSAMSDHRLRRHRKALIEAVRRVTEPP